MKRNLNVFSRYFAASLILTLSSCACQDVKPTSTNTPSNHEKNNVVSLAEAAAPVSIPTTQKNEGPILDAEAIIKSLGDNKIEGIVSFYQEEDGVLIVADVDGLTPGEHGFHIHEFGDCSAKDGSSVGNHFNPTNSKHGGPDDEDRHVGDLGNLVADETGYAYYERLDKRIKLDGKNSIIGRSIVIHADKDDFKTQPAGASGKKIACGVIEIITE